jgi:thioredoxin 1
MIAQFFRRFRSSRPPAPATPARPRPRPIHVTDENFEAVVLSSDRLAVVDFWADWCEPCHIMAAIIQFLAEDFDGQILVAKMDVEENPTIPARYNLLGIPTIIFFRHGEEIDRQMGIISIDVLRERVEAFML